MHVIRDCIHGPARILILLVWNKLLLSSCFPGSRPSPLCSDQLASPLSCANIHSPNTAPLRYDVELVQARFHELQKRRQEGCVEDMMFALRTDLIRNLGNMCNPELHKDRLHTPPLISEYLGEVCEHLRIIKDASEQEDFGLDDKLSFFHEVRHAFGRTALLLSGGAAMGAFHLGVVKTLIEHGLLPRVVAGSSVGSIICSFTATRPWVQLQAFFQGPLPKMHFFDEMGSVIMTAHKLFTRGAMQEIGPLQRKMRELIGDMTFQEAYDISGRVLCITVCSSRPKEPPRLLNYLSSPNVVIWSAVTASCAFPGLFSPQVRRFASADSDDRDNWWFVSHDSVRQPGGRVSKLILRAFSFLSILTGLFMFSELICTRIASLSTDSCKLIRPAGAGILQNLEQNTSVHLTYMDPVTPQELMAKDRFGRLVPYHPPTELGPDKNGGIGARHWRDGSLETDLPIGPLKELFNVNHFIVSQANPHIAPLLRLKETVRQYGGQWASKVGLYPLLYGGSPSYGSLALSSFSDDFVVCLVLQQRVASRSVQFTSKMSGESSPSNHQSISVV